ncbi:hypothetical protein CAOG_02405 [Capsaspora owczarzaki ATCC 30864]|uniref:hypothetical protein n=1 Tax=Capsaspora owczarzaki (strain ATCC 30864) TaxID=595528 RepID=UPI0001FE4A0C|nr:hypothetical protein CAOG_02405 [Capsaspora owczarzaki ATCC 30864]|eukprot:XP_004349155.1 hypothetical protein CAOG_02405 [Capsaspora owczarzaki ATCC 30864]
MPTPDEVMGQLKASMPPEEFIALLSRMGITPPQLPQPTMSEVITRLHGHPFVEQQFPKRRESFQPRLSAIYELLKAVAFSFDEKQRSGDRRNRFPLLQLTTISGMGKSSFGFHALDEMQRILKNVTTWAEVGLPNLLVQPQELLNLLKNTHYIFIDFNGLGDNVEVEETSKHRRGRILAVRLAARGLLNTTTKGARENSTFCDTEGVWNTRQVLDEIFVRHRHNRQIAADQIALLFVHVDEFQLAIERLAVKVEFIEAVDILKVQLEDILQYNLRQTRNLVVLLTTGTSHAGITLHSTQHKVCSLPLQPLDLNLAQHLFGSHHHSIHQSWLTHDGAKRLLGDMGGVPVLIQSLADAAATISFENPAAPHSALRVLDDIFRRYKPRERAGSLGEDGLLELVQLSLSCVPVSADTPIGPVTVHDLTMEGVLATTPVDEGPDMYIHMPLPLLDQCLSHCEAGWTQFVRRLVEFPMRTGGDGFACEAAVALSLASRMAALQRKGGTLRLGMLLGLELHTVLDGAAGEAAADFLRYEIQLQVDGYEVMTETRQFMSMDAVHTPQLDVHAYKELALDRPLVSFSLKNLPAVVLLSAPATPHVDLRFAVRIPKSKPMKVFLQIQDHVVFSDSAHGEEPDHTRKGQPRVVPRGVQE